MDGLRTLGISWPPFRIFLYNTSAAFTIPPLMLCPNLASWLHKMVFKYCWRLTISHTTRDSSHFHDGKSHRLCVFLSTVKVLYAALFWFSYYIFSEPESYVFGSLISCFIFSLWCLYCYYMWIHVWLLGCYFAPGWIILTFWLSMILGWFSGWSYAPNILKDILVLFYINTSVFFILKKKI